MGSDMESMQLLVDGLHGIYVPQMFARMVRGQEHSWGIDKEDLAVLLCGPDHPMYDDAWEQVLADASLPFDAPLPSSLNGVVDSRDLSWSLLQHEGDLYMLCEGLARYVRDNELALELLGEEP